jgi:alkanesulfonate monooxygenase SsuD/methylene tetrahydromethanopterin reductase-like flavin-dependent oxidoreductase (luciferase family)
MARPLWQKGVTGQMPGGRTSVASTRGPLVGGLSLGSTPPPKRGGPWCTIQQPIPIWMGGDSDVVIRRAARLADGWITLPSFRPGPAGQQTVNRIHGLLREAGRDPAVFGIEARMALAKVPAEARANEIAAWRAMRGITHLCVNTMGLDLAGPEEHVRTLERFKRDVLG